MNLLNLTEVLWHMSDLTFVQKEDYHLLFINIKSSRYLELLSYKQFKTDVKVYPKINTVSGSPAKHHLNGVSLVC